MCRLRSMCLAAAIFAWGAIPATYLAVPLAAQSPSSSQVARSSRGVVATAHPLATEAAVKILEAGGNAADAAVAAAFALAVVEPSMNGLGGRTQILIRSADGAVSGIDATTQAPASYDPQTAPRASYGYPTIGVPGTVAGLMRLLDERGTLTRAAVMASAIDYAAHGNRLLPGEARRQALAAEKVSESVGGRMYFQEEDGTPYDAGDLFVQSDLARTLEAIVDGGADAFYRGEIAGRIVQDMKAHGAAVTRASLRDYRAEDAQIVRGSFRGYDLEAMYAPTGGAVTIEILQILENFPLAEFSEAEWAAAVGQAIALAFQDARFLGQPDGAEKLTSKAFARERAELIRLPSQGTGIPDIVPQPDRPSDQGHTTHMSVVDADGMAVSLTQTVGPNMGSKVVAPGLGFVYAATLGGYLGEMEPGARALSFISPMVVSRDGEPVLVLGAAGGARIVTAVAQVVLRVLEQGFELPEAVALPRVHTGFGGGAIELETSPGIGWDPAVLEQLQAWGLEVTGRESVGAFGRIHALHYHPTSAEWEAVADPDWEGTAGGPGGR
jgi:gamma-glutamyltranspeptidase / glutathione hydrolase